MKANLKMFTVNQGFGEMHRVVIECDADLEFIRLLSQCVRDRDGELSVTRALPPAAYEGEFVDD